MTHDSAHEGEQSPRLTQDPPRSLAGVLMRLGPGMIIAASIVGSGELIGTTKTGAEAQFWLLWLILVGCVIKVFTQVEFGRYAVAAGQTTLAALNEVPGPRWRVNWLLWYWLLMFVLGLGQLGGIVGGVGQTMALSFPLSGDFQQFAARQDAHDQAVRLRKATAARVASGELAADRAPAETPLGPRPSLSAERVYDDVLWSALAAGATSIALVKGRYRLIQNVSTALVAAFTVVTVFNVLALQTTDAWRITARDIWDGLSFRLPPGEGSRGVATALASFGIIGVGASELIAYPYWCLERGYARYTGPRTDDETWARRARGWMRVMQFDVWISMVVYTLATVAFYLLGAAVLGRSGRIPENDQLVPTLIRMYEPVFGAWAPPVFVVGAFAVLYSTFFVATAGNARMAADALRVFRIGSRDDASLHRWMIRLSGIFPLVSLAIYVVSKSPVTLVLVSGMAQSIMLPMLGGAALFFRYQRCDARISPGRAWDVFLWLSVGGLLVAGVWGAASTVLKFLP